MKLIVNGNSHNIVSPAATPLAQVLRRELLFTGTKIGCETGDCGACTVLLEGKQVCSCLVPIGQCDGQTVVTVEGFKEEPILAELRLAFHHTGAAQCGICTPGMLLSSLDLLKRNVDPDVEAIQDALGGTLCRCTGYIKIIEGVQYAARRLRCRNSAAQDIPQTTGAIVGARVPRKDGLEKVSGSEQFGSDFAPADALWLRVVRSPYASARFVLGDFATLYSRNSGLTRVLTAKDIPGQNGFGIYPHIKDQPVLSDGRVRYRGEAILALVGEKESVEAIPFDALPIKWQQEEPLLNLTESLAPDAPRIHADKPGNILIHGCAQRGDDQAIIDKSGVTVEGQWVTARVEHSYIEPEAGYAERIGDRIEVTAPTQAPYMDLEEVANVLGVKTSAVRVIPTACGGGFGGKLDVSVQPILAVAAWLMKQPVCTVYSRAESMISSTKRHPAKIKVRASTDSKGYLQSFELNGDYDTGAYASWGPTVAGRVPVHCTGPYSVPRIHCRTRAIYTNNPPSGAFRGFGTPQAALAQELLYDELAEKLDIDRLEFRLLNAFRPGDITPSGQKLDHSVGMVECLEAVRSDWCDMVQQAEEFNRTAAGDIRRGVGIACMWYGCGNTGLSNPSTMRVALKRNGRLIFFSGAVDIGQGSTTVLLQIMADAVGLAIDTFDMVIGDTDLTADAGKTSASRQTFVSGKAAFLAGRSLREKLLTILGVDDNWTLTLNGQYLFASKHNHEARTVDLSELGHANGIVAEGIGEFDPPITMLDEKGQGNAYATFAFATQICSVDTDIRLGIVKPIRFVAAHDVGRAINPSLVEGQIQGGITQGLGMALMEEYLPEKTENLHDYLIPTIGDIPTIDIKLIEVPEPSGPYGAKGVGEPALVPTPAAILSAVRDGTGVMMREIPLLPHRVRDAICNAGVEHD